MTSPELSARLQYLNDSAHLLAATAPETSRHLMSRHDSLLFDSNLDPPTTQKRKACGACGSIMILGWNGVLELKQPGRKNTRRQGKVSNPQRAVIYTCDCCGSKTRNYFPTPHQKYKPRTKPSKTVPILATASPGTAQTKETPSLGQSSNSSSKKRAKSRKQGSLQAILAKQKASEGASASGFGLDLMDFMKNG
ncbi:hypothetical protein LHYA1_G005360 [Lachnellula hyalina]|uniref:Uncharacterized protein n=1 Tax=Lachnellula hyalina TaxID=1316788 RepID=A0A8H8R0H4_9HELO|nr:uncharacterized protein LHYA1_G005360 [Lachnellula hyalina]TVY26178.1 hypothetical protein LHYA1_G005360 [Lachnellula hyalina]